MTVPTARSPAPAADRLLLRLEGALDRGAVLRGADVGAGHAVDGDKTPGCRPDLVLRPRDTAQVAAILAAAEAEGQPLVIQGGRTGLAGGARPRPGEIALSLERMAAVAAPDPLTATITAEAGAPLEKVQAAARAAGLHLGVDIGARGTATIGGMIATNAGGIRVLRYGMFREQVAGLEAVLADGSVIDLLDRLPKDNAGHDLRQVFIGSEGTLGVVTRARLRLHPAPRSEALAFLALPGFAAALTLLPRLRTEIGDLLSAFEVIDAGLYAETTAFLKVRPPVAPGAGLYAMVEIQGRDPERDAARFETALTDATGAGLIDDAVLAASGREMGALWAIRDGLSDYLFAQPDMTGHDIGLPLSRMEAFLTETARRLRAVDPAARPMAFGHLGDGNLHYMVQTREPAATAQVVMAAVAAAGGTISAEHGIGTEKAKWLPLVRSPAAIASMRRLKRAFDPAGILNRGRILSEE